MRVIPPLPTSSCHEFNFTWILNSIKTKCETQFSEYWTKIKGLVAYQVDWTQRSNTEVDLWPILLEHQDMQHHQFHWLVLLTVLYDNSLVLAFDASYFLERAVMIQLEWMKLGKQPDGSTKFKTIPGIFIRNFLSSEQTLVSVVFIYPTVGLQLRLANMITLEHCFK